MNLRDFRFHHFGLASSTPYRAVEVLEQLNYHCNEGVYDRLQNVWLRWCTHTSAPAVEIVSPADEDGPLTRILASQASSFYHLCWESDISCENAVLAMRSAGLRAVTVRQPLPAVLFAGRRVSFHMIQGFGLVEILESEAVPRAGTV